MGIGRQNQAQPMGNTLSPSPSPGTLTGNTDPTVQGVADEDFFALLSGATRNLDTAQGRLTEAADTVSGISENFTHPAENRSTFGKGGRSFSRGGPVGFQGGGALDAAFLGGVARGQMQQQLQPLVSSPIPPAPTSSLYTSAGGLTSLMQPNVYQGVNAYNQRMPLGPSINPSAIQMAQGFANPSVFSYNNPNPQAGGMAPSGLAQGQMQQGQMPMAGQPSAPVSPQPIQPYTMGT